MLRTILKTNALYACNILAFLCRLPSRPSVLMYHSFDNTNWKHSVSPAQLQQQLLFLTKKKDVVPLKDVVAFVKGEKKISAKSVAITVDDGYENTYTVLFPLAKKYGIPFTIFLTTNLSSMEKLGNAPRPTWAQLQEMVDSGLVHVGVHGHTHINFPEVLRFSIQEAEIIESKSLIARKLGVEPLFVAYPAGRYDMATYQYVQQHFTAAFSTHQGHVHINDDIFMLRRVPVDRGTTLRLFKARLLSGYQVYLRLAHNIRKIHA